MSHIAILEPDLYIYACVFFICLVSEACRETLQDYSIGPKDMCIVLLHVCLYLLSTFYQNHQLLLYSLLRLIYVVS